MLFAAVVLLVSAALAAETDPLVRELFVPFEDLNVVLKEGGRRVFLTRDEYDELLARAGVSAEQPVPHATSLLSTDYEATVEGPRARVRGKILIDVAASGIHAVPLSLRAVGLRSATLDGRPAPIARSADGQTILLVDGRGQHKLLLDIVVPLQVAAAEQTMQLQLPHAATGRFRLSVPGDVEMKSGAAVLRREVNADATLTEFELLPRDGLTTLVMTLNNRQRQQQQVVVARNVLIDELTESYERLHVTASMQVVLGAATSFRFAIPDSFEVTDVTTPLLSRWQVVDDGSRQVLEVVLREAATDTTVVHIVAQRNSPVLADWQMPAFQPLDVIGAVSVVGLLLEQRLETRALDSGDLIPVDVDTLTATLPESIHQAEPGAPSIRPVAAFYAPHGDFQLTGEFVRPAARVQVVSTVLLKIQDSGLEVNGGFALLPLAEEIFGCNFLAEAGWQVTQVTFGDGQPLIFEEYAEDDGRSRIRVTLPASVLPGNGYSIRFHAVRVPDDWADEWQSREVQFPRFEVVEATSEQGAIAIQARDDLIVRPQQTQSLASLNESDKAEFNLGEVPTNLAYRFDSRPFTAVLTAERVPPRVTAETYSFLTLQPRSLRAVYEIVYAVTDARTRQLSFSLPADTPEEVSVRGLDGVAIKESTSTVEDDRRRWDVLLANPARGTVRLQISFDQPLEPQGTTTDEEPQQLADDLELPIVQAVDVAYQTGSIAVEGSAELEITVSTEARKIDVGELIDADHQPGSRLLGAFGFTGQPAIVTANATRPAQYGLPEAIIERAELFTAVSAAGISQSAARFHLRTKAQFVEVQLPDGSSFWSAYLDGRPTKPQRGGDSILISMPAEREEKLRNLQIVYETPIRNLGMWGGLELTAAKLFLRDQVDAPAVELPVADLAWSVSLPAGYRISAFDGTVFPDTQDRNTQSQLAARRTPLEQVAQGLASPSRRGLLTYSLSSAVSADADAALTIEDGIEQAESATREPADMFGGVASGVEATFSSDEKEPLDQLADRPTVETGNAGLPTDSDLAPGKVWALEGLRSLEIDLTPSDKPMSFQSLGADPMLDITLVDSNRFQLLGWGAALLVIAIGLMFAGRPVSAKIKFVGAVLVLATVLPLAVGWEREFSRVLDLVFYAGLALVPIYLVLGCLRHIGSWFVRNPQQAAVAVTLAVAICLPQLAFAQTETEAQVGPITVRLIGPKAPVQVPDDVVIVPYDPGDEAGVTNAQRVIVPYQKYVELWDLAYPDRKLLEHAPPADFAWGGARWRTTMVNEDSLLIEGTLDLNTYVEGVTEVPLVLAGGVLEKALLDAQPARIYVVHSDSSPPPSEMQQRAQPSAETATPSLITLHTSEKGPHQLELAIRYRLTRRGGWRVLDGVIPHTPAASLEIAIPDPRTELRVSGVADQEVYETAAANETIATALAEDGRLQMQWRPKVGQAAVDRSLTVESDAAVDIQEDGVRLTWQLEFRFPRSQRDLFTIDVTDDYLVERVTGQNIRGWQRGDGRVNVTLLEPARDLQQITLHLTRRGAVGADEFSDFEVPVVQVSEALLHEGQLVVRRSPLLNVRTVESAGIVRTDVDAVQAARSAASESPLGIRPYQAYRFNHTPFRLRLAVTPLAARVDADIQTVLRVAEVQRTLESRVVIQVEGRPIHQIHLQLPGELELQEVHAPGDFQWSVDTDDQGVRRLAIYLGQGQIGEFSVVLKGRLGSRGTIQQISLPAIQIENVSRHESAIVVQTDPDYDARLESLANCRQVLLDRVRDWLAENQRSLSRLAVHSSSAEFGAVVTLVRRVPRVSCRTFSNLKVTARAFEETVLLDFDVQEAGVDEVSFSLPADLRDARISVPQLKEKTIEDVSAERIRVRLQLQDEVMGQLRVLIESDRLIADDQRSVPIPVVESAVARGQSTPVRVEQRFVAWENAGRDEVVAQPSQLEPISREQGNWRLLTELLGEQVTQAYLVSPGANAAQLTIQTRDRQAVETVGARIAFAELILVVDPNGTYRGRQVYQVDNRTEQFLEVVLPDEAQLWTARVAGRPVKPILGNGVVRLPLVKTAEGDQDYTVELKYGGGMEALGQWTAVTFPLPKTQNIRVEQSQVRLRLPESYHWFDFRGTMRHVTQEQDLLAGYLKYKTEQIAAANASLASKNPFARVRALSNLRSVVSELEEFHSRSSLRENSALSAEVTSNRKALESARQKLAEQTDESWQRRMGEDNRLRLNTLFEQQSNVYSRNLVNQQASNFDVGVVDDSLSVRDYEESGEQEGSLRREWLDSNQLAGQDREDDARGQERYGKAAAGTKNYFQNPAQQLDAPQVVADDDLDQMKKEAARPDTSVRYRSDASRVQRFEQQLQVQQAAESDGYGGYGGGDSAAGRGGYGGGYGERGYGATAGVPPMTTASPAAPPVPGQPIAGAVSTSANGVFDGRVDVQFGFQTPASQLGQVPTSGPAEGRSAPSGLASLDVALPIRGAEYLFTTPRGDVQITARAVTSPLIGRLLRLAAVLGILAVCVVGYRTVQRVGFDRILNRGVAGLLILGGLILLILGAAPALASLAIVVGVVQLVRLTWRRVNPPNQATPAGNAVNDVDTGI